MKLTEILHGCVFLYAYLIALSVSVPAEASFDRACLLRLRQPSRVLGFAPLADNRFFLLEIAEGAYRASLLSGVDGSRVILYSRQLQHRLDGSESVFSRWSLSTDGTRVAFNGYEDRGYNYNYPVVCTLATHVCDETQDFEYTGAFRWSRRRPEILWVGGTSAGDGVSGIHSYDVQKHGITRLELRFPAVVNFEMVEDRDGVPSASYVSGVGYDGRLGLFRARTEQGHREPLVERIEIPAESASGQGFEGVLFIGINATGRYLVFSSFGAVSEEGADSSMGSMLWAYDLEFPSRPPHLIDGISGGNPQTEVTLPVQLGRHTVQYRKCELLPGGESCQIVERDIVSSSVLKHLRVPSARPGAFTFLGQEMVFVSQSAGDAGSLRALIPGQRYARALVENADFCGTPFVRGQAVTLPRVDPSQIHEPHGILFESPFCRKDCRGVIYVHGGSPGYLDSEFDLNDKVQWLLENGFDVLQVNYQGVRYGNSTRVTAIPNLFDVLSGRDFLLARGRVRRGSVGIIGRSLGGYLVNQVAVQHPGWFAAHVSESGLAQVYAKAPQGCSGCLSVFPEGSNAREPFEASRVGVEPDADPAYYREISPINAAAELDSPILLVVGGRDVQVDPRQGLGFYEELRKSHPEMGDRIVLLYREQEDHHMGARDPRNYFEYLQLMVAFFGRYL